MIIIALVLSIFFIVIIAIICRAYLKDIIELEERILQLEKRVNQNGIFISNIGSEIFKMKEGDSEMACKKGKGGRRK